MIKKNLFLKHKIQKIHNSSYEEIHVQGAKVLFLQEKSLPSIQYNMLFPKAGSNYETKKTSGLAYLTAYLSEQGAGDLTSSELQKELNELGTSFHISVGQKSACIELSGLSWHKEQLWSLFEKILINPHFTKEEWKILQKQFIEKRIKLLDKPSAIAKEFFKSSFSEKPSGGDLTSLSKITTKNIKNFYKKNFQKGEPILIVTGYFNKALKQKILSFFEKNFSKSKETNCKTFQVKQKKKSFKLLSKNSLLQSHIYIGRLLPSYPVQTPKKGLALQIANSILGRDSSSRLFHSLREKKGLTYGAYSHISFNDSYGLFFINGTTKNSSCKEFLEEALKILKNFYKKGITKQELKRTKQELKSQYLQSMETAENQLYQIAYYKYCLKVNPLFLKNYLNILKKMSLDYVNQQIQEWLSLKDLQVRVYGPSSLKSQLTNIKTLPNLSNISFKDLYKKELSFS